MQIIDKAVMADGTKIQLEDWHSENSEKYPDLHGYTIGSYPIAKNTSRSGWIRKGETFRLGIARNEYANYTDEMVLTDYEALKNGTKSLADLREHFWNREKDAFYLGLADKEPEWQQMKYYFEKAGKCRDCIGDGNEYEYITQRQIRTCIWKTQNSI